MAKGLGGVAEGMARSNRERAILSGRLRAEGLTREFLNDASLYDLISLVAYVDQLWARGLKPTEIQADLAEIEKTHFEKKHEAAVFKRLKAKDRRRLKDDNRLTKEDEQIAFESALSVDQGSTRVKTYIDLGGSDMKHIEVLMKLDQLDRP